MSFLHHHLEEGARTKIHLLVLPPGVKTPTECKDTKKMLESKGVVEESAR